MDYRAAKSLFVNACIVVYPGDYTKDQLANIFDENVVSVIETNRKNESKYIDYCKTLVIGKKLDIDLSTLQAFNDILSSSENKAFSDNDRECYIDAFVSKFIEVFPDLYTYNELYNIIDINVKMIVFDPTGDNRYLPDKKKIILNHVVFDEITFHEFVHAIRGDLLVRFHGIDEGLTELASLMYKQEVPINKIQYENCYYRDMVKVAIKLNEKHPGLFEDYLLRKNVLSSHLSDEIDIIELMETIYHLYDEDYSYGTKEKIKMSIHKDIEKSLIHKK